MEMPNVGVGAVETGFLNTDLTLAMKTAPDSSFSMKGFEKVIREYVELYTSPAQAVAL